MKTICLEMGHGLPNTGILATLISWNNLTRCCLRHENKSMDGAQLLPQLEFSLCLWMTSGVPMTFVCLKALCLHIVLWGQCRNDANMIIRTGALRQWEIAWTVRVETQNSSYWLGMHSPCTMTSMACSRAPSSTGLCMDMRSSMISRSWMTCCSVLTSDVHDCPVAVCAPCFLILSTRLSRSSSWSCKAFTPKVHATQCIWWYHVGKFIGKFVVGESFVGEIEIRRKQDKRVLNVML